MSTRHPRFARLAIVLGLGVLGALTASTPTAAQITTDPYKPFNSNYESFAYPSIPNNGALPNQSRLGAARAQYFSPLNGPDRYNDDLFGDLFDDSRTARSSFSPYYRAYRRADYDYYDAQRKRGRDYLDARRETDPVERAKKVREYRQESRKAAIEAEKGRRTTPGTMTARRGTAAPATSAPYSGRRRSAIPRTATSASVLSERPAPTDLEPPFPAEPAPRPSPAVVRPTPSSGTSTRSTEMLRDSGTRRSIPRPRPPSEPRSPSAGDLEGQTPTEILNRSREMDRSVDPSRAARPRPGRPPEGSP